LPPHRVVRPDGTIVKINDKSSVSQEFKGLLERLKDWRILGVYFCALTSTNPSDLAELALLPMFFSSNYFYAYQGAVNAGKFDGPTRAVVAALEGAGAIIGALLIGFLVLDANWFRRKTRGWLGLACVSIITIIVWSCGLSWQLTFTRETIGGMINYKDDNFAGKGALFFFCESPGSLNRNRLIVYRDVSDYFGDACYQALVYWIMAALSNDPFTIARFAGIYKAVQSAGAAGSFGMDAVETPYLNELLASWIMMLVSFPLAGIVIYTIKDTNYDTEHVDYASDVKKDAEITQQPASDSTEKVAPE
jgi:hypothetical protein